MLLSAAAVMLLSSSCYVKINKDKIFSESASGDYDYLPESSMEYDEDITRIINAGFADIDIYQSDSVNRYELEVSPELAGNIMLEFNDGLLEIKAKENFSAPKYSKVKLKVWSRNLTSLVSAGAGDIDFPGTFCCEDLSIVISGAGDIDIEDIHADGEVSIVIAGAGDAELAGEASSFRYNIAGVGKIDIRKLRCNDVSGVKGGIGKVYR